MTSIKKIKKENELMDIKKRIIIIISIGIILASLILFLFIVPFDEIDGFKIILPTSKYSILQPGQSPPIGTATLITAQPSLNLIKHQGLEKWLITEKTWNINQTDVLINLTVNETVYNWMVDAVANPTMQKCLTAEPYIQEDYPNFDCDNANYRNLLLSKLSNFTSNGFKIVKKGVNQGYVTILGNKAYIHLPFSVLENRDLIEIGESSTVYEYQEENILSYNFSFGQTNLTLIRENGSAEDIYVYYSNDSDKYDFGANVSSMNEDELDNFTYTINSTSQLVVLAGTTQENENLTYPIIYNFQGGEDWNEERHVYSFEGVCEFDYSNCSWESYGKSAIIHFTSKKYIDTKSIEVISGCRTLNDTDREYSLDQDVESTGTCFTVTNTSVELNCNGYEINYSTDGTVGYGVLSTQFNTTVKNCVVVEGESSVGSKDGIHYDTGTANGTIYNNSVTVIGAGSEGIRLDDSDYINVSSNTVYSNNAGDGIMLDDGSTDDNIIDRNNITAISDRCLQLYASERNNATNNNCTAGNVAFYLIYGADGNYFDNNLIETTGASDHAVNIFRTNLNVFNNTVIKTIGSTSWGIILNDDCRDNTFYNTNITTTHATASHGIISSIDINNGTFINGYIHVTGGGTSRDVYMDNSLDAGSSLTLINISYDKSNVEFEAGETENNPLISQEYLDVNVTDSSDDSAIENAGVNLTMINGTLFFSEINTSATGFITQQTVTEFFQNISGRFYYTNYTLDVIKSGFTDYSLSFNLTEYTQIDVEMSSGVSDDNPISINSLPANNTNYTNGTIVTFECNATDTEQLVNTTLWVWNPDTTLNHTNTTAINGTSNSTQFTFNFTVDGNYLWNCYACDNASTTQCDWANNWTLNISDASLPPIDNEYPLFSDYWDNNATLLGSGLGLFNVTLNATNGTVWLEINGSNHTASNTSGQYNVWNVSYSFAINDTYPYLWHSWGNGTDNNYNQSESRSYTVNESVDATPPYFDEDLANQTLSYLTGLNYNINATDETALDSYSVNDTRFNMSVDGNLTNLTTLGSALYWLNISINDTSNNLNSSILFVNITPIASEVNLSVNYNDGNVSILNNSAIDLNCSILTGESTAILELWDNSSKINHGTSPIGNTTAFNVTGQHNITCFYNATQNYSVSYENWWVNVTALPDTTPPDISILHPTNDTNTTNTSLDINYTASDDIALDSCWWTNDSGHNNNSLVSCSNITTVTWEEKLYNITIYINDTSNNINSTSVTFRVDATAPTFDNLDNKTITQSQSLSFDIDATDNLLGVKDFSINDTGNFSIDSSGVLTNVSGLSTEILYWLNVSVNDSLGNTAYGIMYVNVTPIDATPPDISISYPANSSNFTTGAIDVNYTVSDETALDSCWYSNDTHSINTTLASCINITSVTWSEGLHNVRVYANDSSNNINQTSITFRVDTTPPTFTNLANQSEVNGTAISFDINANDAGVGLGTFAINDTGNFTINSATGVLTNATRLRVDTLYWLNVSVNDTLGNTAYGIMYVNMTLPSASKCDGNYNTIRIAENERRVFVKLCEVTTFD